jgi:hypothetical protein
MPFVSPVCGAFDAALFVELPVAFTEPLLFVFGVFFEDSVIFSPFSLCYYFFLYVLKFINISYFSLLFTVFFTRLSFFLLDKYLFFYNLVTFLLLTFMP